MVEHRWYHARGSYSDMHLGNCIFSHGQYGSYRVSNSATPKGVLWVGREIWPPQPYPLADKQAVGVLDGSSLVQQQRLELALLDVIEGVEHHGQELQRTSMEPQLPPECVLGGHPPLPDRAFI